MYDKYQEFIEDNLKVLDKVSQIYIPFKLNSIQKKFINEASGRDIILKARQQGFSSLVLALFTKDFILKENSVSVIVADIAENARDLLARVKNFIESYEEHIGYKIPLKYNSMYELENAYNKSRYIIGTAENTKFGRSKTITNLHLSEAAYYPHLQQTLAGAGTALIPGGKFIIETTANGYNELKTLWDASIVLETDFKALFYPASAFYEKSFLGREKARLGNLYQQEYPDSAEEAFLTSGDMYFNRQSLQVHLKFIEQYEQRQLQNIS